MSATLSAFTARSSATAKIARVGGHYAIQKSFEVTDFGTNTKCKHKETGPS